MPGSNVVALEKMTFEMVNSACGVSAEHRVVSSCPTFPGNFHLPLIMVQLSWLPGRQVSCSCCTHPPSKDTLPERGKLGQNDLEKRETSSLWYVSWSLAVEPGGDMAQFWGKTGAAQRAWSVKEAGSGDESCCCLSLLLAVPAFHSQASGGCRKDRKVSLASV